MIHLLEKCSRVETHGTGVYTAAAGDTGRSRSRVCLLRRQSQDSRGTFDHRSIQIVDREARHGPADDYLFGDFTEATALFDQIADGGTDSHFEVCGVFNRPAAYRDQSLDQRLLMYHRLV